MSKIRISIIAEDDELLNACEINVPEDQTIEMLGNEVVGVLEDFFDVEET